MPPFEFDEISSSLDWYTSNANLSPSRISNASTILPAGTLS